MQDSLGQSSLHLERHIVDVQNTEPEWFGVDSLQLLVFGWLGREALKDNTPTQHSSKDLKRRVMESGEEYGQAAKCAGDEKGVR